MKAIRLYLAMTLMLTATALWAQDEAADIKVTKFGQNIMDSQQRVADRDGNWCAVLKIATNDRRVEVKPNMGVAKEMKTNGMVILWVPASTKYLDINCSNLLPLEFKIPIRLESDRTYEMEVMVNKDNIDEAFPFFLNGGFNVMSIMGPSLSFGYHFGNFNLEAGAVIGLNSSDNIYYYNSDGSLRSAFSYKAVRAQLRAGYDYRLPSARFLTLEPQIGIAFNFISGSAVSGVAGSDKDYMKSVSSMSGLLALRVKFAINSHWSLQITPEYDFGLGKSDDLKVVNDADSKIKAWTDGFNLNLGVMLYF